MVICCPEVQEILSNTVNVIQTIIPDPFRVYEGNKPGVLKQPLGIATENGLIYFVDNGTHKLYKGRLHYPVDLTELAKLKFPYGVDCQDGVLFVSQINDGVVCIDTRGKFIIDQDKLSVKELINGVYFVSIETTNKVITKSLVKR